MSTIPLKEEEFEKFNISNSEDLISAFNIDRYVY
jgi:hypothetical protein